MEDLKNPKVSILIPCYNLGSLITRCLESIPVRDDIEVIIVDDCSKDNTLDLILNFWNKSDLNLKVMRHKTNKGVSVVMNTLYDLAKGEYVYQIDGDDYLYKKWEDALEYLNGADMVYVNAQTNDGSILRKVDEDSNPYWCAGWFKFIRREFLGNERRVFNAYGGDYEMNLSLLKKPHVSVFTDILAYHYDYPREGSIIWNLTHEVRSQ